MTGWRDAPLVEAKGSWRDAPLVTQDAPGATQKEGERGWASSLGPASALPSDYLDPSTPQGKAFLALGLGAVAGPAAVAMGPAGLLSAGKAAITGTIGAGIGGQAGHFIGGGIGFPKEGAAIGSLVGGLAGGINPRSLLTIAKAGHGMGPTLLRALLGTSEGAATGVATKVAAPVATAAAEAAPSLAGKVIDVSMRGDPRKLWAITDAAGKPVQTFLSAGEAMQASHAVKRAAALATTAAEVAPTVAEVAPAVAKAAPAVSKGVEAATRHKALMEFAKDAAAKNPKIGEKIWYVADKAGNPVKILTPDQAGAAKRAGLETGWVRNLWK